MSDFVSPTSRVITLRGVSENKVAAGDPIVRTSVRQLRDATTTLTLRDFIVVGCAIVLVATTGLLYLLQAGEITRIAYKAHDLKVAVERLEQENSTLRLEIAELERLDRVQAGAASLGLEKAGRVRFLLLDTASSAGHGASSDADLEQAP